MSRYQYHYGGGNPPEPMPEPPDNRTELQKQVDAATKVWPSFLVALERDFEWCARELNGPPKDMAASDRFHIIGIVQRLLIATAARKM